MSIKQQDAPKVKICGITAAEEAGWLNEAEADYAGFVFYEKSKRNISMAEAIEIKKLLHPSIKTVAVTVSPTVDELREIERAGFDILQVHRDFLPEVLRECRLPIWRAFNIGALEDMKQEETAAEGRIEAYVLDGASFGSGKTFDWSSGSGAQIRALIGDKKLVLAGGLNPANVAEGITQFAPDIVDVSSGVERENGRGKDEEKIKQFISEVRKNG